MRLPVKFLISVLFVYFIADQKSDAQKVVYSSQEIDSYTYDYLRIGGYNDNGFFLLQSTLPFDTDRDRIGFKSRKFKVTFYDNNLNIAWSKKFDKSDEKDKIETVGIINGKAAVVKSHFMGEESKLGISVSFFDDKGNEQKSTGDIGTVSFDRSSDLDKIKVIASVHNVRYGFIQNEKKKDGTQTLHCIVTDADLNVMRNIKFDVPYPEKNFYYENWLLSDEGDFVVEGSYNSRDNNPNRRRWDAFKLFVSTREAMDAKEYAINNSEIELSGSNIAYDALKNKLVLAGFYNEKNSVKSGIVYATLGLSATDSLHIMRQPIAESTQAKMFSGESSGRSEADIDNLTVEKIVLRNDGGAVLVTEASYISDYSYYDYFTQSYIRNSEYHFENVIVLSVNAYGTIDWDAILRKDQVSTNDNGRYSSFCIAQTDDKINVVYNTRIEKNNSIASFSVSNAGKTAESEIVKPEDRILMIPYAGKQVSADEIAVPCWNRKKLIMAKLIF